MCACLSMSDYKKGLQTLSVRRDLTDVYPVPYPSHLGRQGLEKQSSSTYWLPSRETFEAQYVKLLRNLSFLWWFISLTSLSTLPVQSSPPIFISAFFPFPTHTAFLILSSLGWLVVCPFGRLRGTVGERQVVRAPCLPFPTARVKCCWTLTPVGPHSQNRRGTQFSQPDPIESWTLHWRKKEPPPSNPPSQLWSVPFLCLLVKQGRTTGRH